MTQALDRRIVQIGIEVDGALKIYDGLFCVASGTKYANPNQDECEVAIANLDKATRDAILQRTSPFNDDRTAKRLIVSAGRQSTGASQIYLGDITAATISQPPDLTLTIKCKTGNAQAGNIVSRSQPAQQSLRAIAQAVASDLGVTLDFQATDKTIANYSHIGGALKQVNRISEAGAVNAYLDGDRLVVKDANVPLTGKLRLLDRDSGMIGIPEITEQGIKVKFLLDNQTTLGGALQVTSTINPAVNGTYCIYQLGFEIASRDTAFYWIASAKRLD